MTIPVFRDCVQFVQGDLRGLIAQVIDTNDGRMECFHRDYNGQVRFFTVRINDDFVVIGKARIGPKNDSRGNRVMAEPPPPIVPLPPPLDPLALLGDPLPADVPIVSLGTETAIPAIPLTGAGVSTSPLVTEGGSGQVTAVESAPVPSILEQEPAPGSATQETRGLESPPPVPAPIKRRRGKLMRRNPKWKGPPSAT